MSAYLANFLIIAATVVTALAVIAVGHYLHCDCSNSRHGRAERGHADVR